MVDLDTPLTQHFFEVTVAHAVAAIPSTAQRITSPQKCRHLNPDIPDLTHCRTEQLPGRMGFCNSATIVLGGRAVEDWITALIAVGGLIALLRFRIVARCSSGRRRCSGWSRSSLYIQNKKVELEAVSV